MIHQEKCATLCKYIQTPDIKSILNQHDLYELILHNLLQNNFLSETADRIDDLHKLYRNHTEGLYQNPNLLQNIYEFIDRNKFMEVFFVLHQYCLAYSSQSILSHYEKENFMKVRLYRNSYEKYIPRIS